MSLILKGANLEVKDNGPYEAQCELRVPISDFVITDVHQLDLK